MVSHLISPIFTIGLTLSTLVSPIMTTFAQAQQEAIAPQDSFASENAILDTSILFAIGAREARQELRGAFGWPTFQEGLVEGVYFRFDPDGYARFAPSPRLDSDVFEVICRPRTYACMGRKGAMSITLNARGQIQLQLENVVEKDRFFVVDGISELELPKTLLQPLEPRLELLLSSGGELIVRRGEANVDQISLLGFSAVVTYLRWVTAQQDYTVLPRGWPVPNATIGNEPSGLTQASVWQSPMPQPHVVIQTVPGTNIAAQTYGTAPSQPAPSGTSSAQSMESTISLLNDLIQDRRDVKQMTNITDATQPQGRIQELQTMVKLLTDELHRLQNPQNQPLLQASPQPPATFGTIATLPRPRAETAKEAMPPAESQAPSSARTLAMRLEYLIEEIGLQPEVALMLVQQGQDAEAESQLSQEQNSVVSEILQELKAQIPQVPALEQSPTDQDNDYQLLSDYLQKFSKN